MLTQSTAGRNVEQRFGWQVVGLLFAASAVNYTDRAALGVVVPQIRSELSLTNADYGLAVNVFLITYTVFSVVGGGWRTTWGPLHAVDHGGVLVHREHAARAGPRPRQPVRLPCLAGDRRELGP